MSDPEIVSTRPYLIRAIYEWCTDNGLTPYLAVVADASVQVPAEYVKDGEIVLNVSFDATSGLDMGNEYVRFQARFGGVARQIIVPVDHVIAIYARENGQGMAFPPPEMPEGEEGTSQLRPSPVAEPEAAGAHMQLVSDMAEVPSEDGDDTPPPSPPGKGGKRASLRLVK